MIINFNFLVLNPHIRMDHMELTAAHDDVTLEIWNLKFEIWSLKFEIWKFSCNYVSNLERISSSQVSYCEHTWFLLTNATFKNYSVNRNSQVGYKQYEQSILYSGETMDHLYSTALCRINGCPLKSFWSCQEGVSMSRY